MVSDGKTIQLKVPAGRARILDDQGYDGKEIIFGIRPEDIHSEQAFLETWPDAIVNSVVSVSELLGATEQLYLKSDDTEYIANVNARDFHNPGDQVKVGFDINKAHFFDKETTMAITKDRFHWKGRVLGDWNLFRWEDDAHAALVAIGSYLSDLSEIISR